MRLEDLRPDADALGLEGIRVGHEATDEPAARAWDLGDQVGDQSTGTRLDGRDPPIERETAFTEPGCQCDQIARSIAVAGLDRRGRPGRSIVRHDQGRCVFSGAFGGANSQVSGTPDLPSVPSEVPFNVK